jgi:ABC-type lipoprotein export system ATPase subunit/ABC-type antimicrobial peptide transport system permease subunit
MCYNEGSKNERMTGMLKLDNVSKYYQSEQTVNQALRRITLNLNNNEFVVITGESGSGKSTLLNVLSGLDTYEEGELYIAGEETSYYSKEDWEHYRSQYIGFIFQNYNIIDAYTVYQNVLAALIIQGYDEEKRKERALELIDQVGLTKQAHQKSSTLSGGQKQRVSIARALAKDAPVIVADEPTGNLDKDTSKTIIELLKDISKNKLVIVVTHSYEQVKDVATRHVRLFDGEIVEDNVIKKTDAKDFELSEFHSGMTIKEQIMMAFRNLVSMPKRLILMLLIALFIVAAFSLTYGAQISNQTVMYDGWNPVVNNSHQSRFIMSKWDGTEFSSNELTNLQNNRLVKDIITFDPIIDTDVLLISNGSGFDANYRYTSIMPSTVLTSRDLKTGRLPQNQTEIVVYEGYQGQYQLDDTLDLSFFDERIEFEVNNATENNSVEVTVVGILDGYGNHSFVHPDLLDVPLYQFYSISDNIDVNMEYQNTEVTIGQVNIIIDDSINDNDIIASYQSMNLIKNMFGFGAVSNQDLASYTFGVTLDHQLIEANTVDINIVDTFDPLQDTGSIKMNTATFNALFVPTQKQISLIIEDSYDAEKLIETLDDDTYFTLYPASYEWPGSQGFQIFERILSVFLMVVLFVVLYFITYITFKNIMVSRKKDYVIFRSIGATKKDLYRITIFELIMVFVMAYIVILTFLILNATVFFLIPDYLRFFTIINYISMSALLVLLAVLTGLRFNTRIFKDSVMQALRVE